MRPRPSHRLGAALLTLATLIGCAAPAPRDVAVERREWRFGGRPGSELRTAHYQIHTTVDDERLIEMFPALVEGAFDHYQTLVPPAREPNAPLRTFFFASRQEWTHFTYAQFPRHRARVLARVRNGGYSEGALAAIQYVSHAVTFPLFAHEGFHQYLYAYVNPRVPAWLNEGLAVCCEGQRWSGRRVAFDIWDNPMRRNTLADRLLRKKLIPLRTLLRTHPGEIINGPPSAVGAYYSQVWALVLYLREGPYAEQFARLIDRLGDPNLERYARAAFLASAGEQYSFGECLFQSFITQDLEQFERQYIAFMRVRMLGERHAAAQEP